VLFIALILVVLTAAAYALVYDKSYYDRIAWTWEYYAPASTSYNCLGYATGSYYWEWPWSGYPTRDAVNFYLGSRYGYQVCYPPYQPRIIAYGTYNNAVEHFSRCLNSTTTRAKWGQLEVMTSYSWDPYYPEPYGSTIERYR